MARKKGKEAQKLQEPARTDPEVNPWEAGSFGRDCNTSSGMPVFKGSFYLDPF